MRRIARSTTSWRTWGGDLLAAADGVIHRWDGSAWSREGPHGEPPGFSVRGFTQDTTGSVWAATTWGLLRLGPSPELLTSQDVVEALFSVAPELNPQAVPTGILPGRPWGPGFGLRVSGSAIPTGSPMIVLAVAPGGPAAAAGIVPGDRLLPPPDLVGSWSVRRIEELDGPASFLVQDAENQEERRITLTPEETEGEVVRPDIIGVHATAKGWLWMVRPRGELLRFDPAGDPLDSSTWTHFDQEDGLDLAGATRVRGAPDGTVWSVSESGLGGVNWFDGETWTSFTLSNIGGGDINPSVLPTRDGAVWVAGQSGVHVWRSGQWSVFTLSDAPLPGGSLRLEEDLAGRVWMVGSGGETVVLDQGSSRWTSLEDLSFQAASSDGRERWYLDNTGRVVREGPAGAWRSFGPEHGLMNAPTAVVLDATGTPWAAGGHDGVAATARLEGGDQWSRTLHPELSWSIDYRAAFLAPDGVLWFGGVVDRFGDRGQRGGVLSFDGAWTHHLSPAAPGSAYGIAATADGRVWVGGRDGLFAYDGTAWERVAVPEALSASTIDVVHSRGDETLWVGSRAVGLFRYTHGDWTQFGLTEGLPANSIVDVLSDEDGTWALTGAGLARFDGASWSSHGFGPGLPTALRGRLRRGPDSLLWLTTFHPSTSGLTLNRVEPPYRGRSIGIAPDTLAPATSLRAVPPQISRPGNLSLFWTGADPWNVTAPSNLEFSVRVDDGAWSPFSRETSRFLDALPAGSHDIAVRARDADGNVEVLPAATSVVVEPPVWQLLWFQLLVGSLVLVGLWQTRRVFVRDRALRVANAELEDRVLERTRELEAAYGDLARSVDDRKEIEGRLRQAQKMDALGRLAGGLAHDFNNLLTVISANTSLTLLDANEEQREGLESVLQATHEAEALTRRLLALGRQQELEPVSVDLSAALRNMLPLLKPLTRGEVELRLDLPDGLPLVRHDPGQLPTTAWTP